MESYVDDDIVIFNIGDQLDLVNTSEALDLFHSFFTNGFYNYVFDFHGSKGMNTVGLDFLTAAKTKVMGKNGDIVIANSPPWLEEAFTLSAIDLLFEMFNSVEEAATHFK